MDKFQKKHVGMVDQPLDPKNSTDSLNVTSYIKGLTEFVKECNTPMAIAIQGDWGTGKTSMMNMIDEELTKGEVKTITFNTWQYSQFKMEDNLSLSFLGYIIGKVYKENPKEERIKKALNFMKKATNFMARTVVKQVVDVDLEKNSEEYVDNASIIEDLKEDFQQAVIELLNQEDKERLVIFIDDLDRLNPEVAVELLEVIKVFLDVESCVFVLAIDYGVVIQGIKKKFGDNVSIEKSRSFFDKIIQLPFKMPVSLYNLQTFFKSTLGEEIKDVRYINELENIIKISVGGNPRTIKRLFNSYQLISKVMKYDDREEYGVENYSDKEKTLLLGVLCMQMAFEPLYEYLMNPSKWMNYAEQDNIFKVDGLESNDEIEKLRDKLKDFVQIDEDLSERRIKQIGVFIKEMATIIFSQEQESNGKETGKIDWNQELEKFRDILAYSSITSTTGGNKMSTVNIRLTEELTSNLKVIGVKYGEEIDSTKSKEKIGKGMSASMVWILEKICEKYGYGEKLNTIVTYRKDIGLNDRVFAEMLEPEVKNKYTYKFNQVKHIRGTDVKIVMHYGSNDLRKHLIKILNYLDIEPKQIELICEKIES